MAGFTPSVSEPFTIVWVGTECWFGRQNRSDYQTVTDVTSSAWSNHLGRSPHNLPALTTGISCPFPAIRLARNLIDCPGALAAWLCAESRPGRGVRAIDEPILAMAIGPTPRTPATCCLFVVTVTKVTTFSNTNTVALSGEHPPSHVCVRVDRDESDAILKILLLYQEEYNKIEKKEKAVTFVT